MSSTWRRRRRPDEVPTPVAVAVSDFCRRAGGAASATAVREALSLLTDEEDFSVRGVTDAEPAARPLGPFALVDILRGTAPELAAERQRCGYYELVQELARTAGSAAAAHPEAPAPPRPEAALSAAAPLRTPPPPKAAEPRAATLQERIAPRRRLQGQTDPAPEPPEEEAPRTSFKRALPPPRGRFTRLTVLKQPLDALTSPSSGTLLEQLLAQYTHRVALVQAVGEQFSGHGGSPLSWTELEEALRHHGLLEALVEQERELLRARFQEHRGAAGRVAWALDIRPAELPRLVSALGMTEEMEAVRDRFRREALATPELRERLDLLARGKYLADLGIARRFKEALARDLREKLAAALAHEGDFGRAVARVSRDQGVRAERLAQAVERLSLEEEFRPSVDLR